MKPGDVGEGTRRREKEKDAVGEEGLEGGGGREEEEKRKGDGGDGGGRGHERSNEVKEEREKTGRGRGRDKEPGPPQTKDLQWVRPPTLALVDGRQASVALRPISGGAGSRPLLQQGCRRQSGARVAQVRAGAVRARAVSVTAGTQVARRRRGVKDWHAARITCR